MSTLLHAHSPGAKVNTAALYNQPFMSHGGHAMVSPAIGIARGMVEAWRDHVRAKSHSHTQEQVAAAIPIPFCPARAAVRVVTAGLLLRRSPALGGSRAPHTPLER